MESNLGQDLKIQKILLRYLMQKQTSQKPTPYPYLIKLSFFLLTRFLLIHELKQN